MKRLGIDVSYCQSRVDWQKVKAAGVQFVMVRVGYCFNNGALHIDKMFKSHMEGAAAVGLDVGVYLYSYATSVPAAKRAAKEVLQAVKPYKLTYPIAFDIEYEKEYPMEPKPPIRRSPLPSCVRLKGLAIMQCSTAARTFWTTICFRNA